MASVTTQIGSIRAPDGTVCTVSVTVNSTTGAVTQATVTNGTPLAATFWLHWNNQMFTQAVAAGATQTWTPPAGPNWKTDQTEFGWGLS